MDWKAVAIASREAFREGANDWISTAQVQGGSVTGSVATLSAGALGSRTSIEAKVKQLLLKPSIPPLAAGALAKTLAAAWNAWAAGFQVVAPMAFPSFVSVALPHAPPTQCLPFPLHSGTSSGEALLKSQALGAKLIEAVRPSAAQSSGDLNLPMQDLAKWVDSSFEDWKRVTMMIGVMGQGPVPAYAPPYVPVGQVVGGTLHSVGPLFSGPKFGKIVP